jgi:hypothetical protein
MTGNELKFLGLTLPSEVRDKFKAQCQASGISQSFVIRALIEKWLDGRIEIQVQLK